MRSMERVNVTSVQRSFIRMLLTFSCNIRLFHIGPYGICSSQRDTDRVLPQVALIPFTSHHSTQCTRHISQNITGTSDLSRDFISDPAHGHYQ